MSFNALAALVDALKMWPEPVSLPERLEDAEPIQLAEARNRFALIAQCATELRKLVDVELATHLTDGKVLPYGDDIIRQSTRGRPKIVDADSWWTMVGMACELVESPGVLLSALYPADAVRLGALPQLAEVLGVNLAALKDTMIEYAEPTAPLSVMPLAKAPMWTHGLKEGEVSSGR